MRMSILGFTAGGRTITVATASLMLGGATLLSACASTATTSTEASPSASASADCSPAALNLVQPGKLTIGTDTPAYPPYFEDDKPANGKGFESAVAYKVAEGLGFTPAQVEWKVVPFNSSYAPGAKDFDFDINQISITPERSKVVDFSDGYYQVNQAVVALPKSPIAKATTIAELKDAKLGAQVGTTSLQFITDTVQPTTEVQVFNDTNDAKSAMQNGTIDGIVVDLPTAYYITAAEIPNAKIVGQFAATEGSDEFGLLFQKGNSLVGCVNQVLATLKSSGELQRIQDQWLAGEAAPYFKE